jgi:hypothetical protein
VQPAECRSKTDGKAQKLRRLREPRKEAIESFATRIFEHESSLSVLLGKG